MRGLKASSCWPTLSQTADGRICKTSRKTYWSSQLHVTGCKWWGFDGDLGSSQAMPTAGALGGAREAHRWASPAAYPSSSNTSASCCVTALRSWVIFSRQSTQAFGTSAFRSLQQYFRSSAVTAQTQSTSCLLWGYPQPSSFDALLPLLWQ